LPIPNVSLDQLTDAIICHPDLQLTYSDRLLSKGGYKTQLNFSPTQLSVKYKTTAVYAALLGWVGGTDLKV